jgi:hypothetical protein
MAPAAYFRGGGAKSGQVHATKCMQLGWKWLAVAYTLAYNATIFITELTSIVTVGQR